MRVGYIYISDRFAGTLTETQEGEYLFEYEHSYFNDPNLPSVSLTLPKDKLQYRSAFLFPFFDGLIPEGWLLDIGLKNWKINPHDRMGILLHLCQDCIGNVSVLSKQESL